MKKNMQLSINIPYKFNWGHEKPLSNQEVTKNLILKAVNQHFPQGLNQIEGRIIGELVEKLDDAVDTGITGAPPACRCMLYANAADNGYEIGLNFASASAKTINATVTYFTS